MVKNQRTFWARAQRMAPAVAAAMLMAACGGGGSGGSQTAPSASSSGTLALTSVSARPDMVSGGDALVRVDVPTALGSLTASARAQEIFVVRRNGVDVTSSFLRVGSSNAFEGLVEGLLVGANNIEVAAKDARANPASLRLTNYPSTGPIFSGPHQTPFNCETTRANLGDPVDGNCSIITRYDYLYRTTTGSFTAMPSTTAYPTNMATTSVNGVVVPYIVRVETGTLNRGIYRIYVLDDPVTPRSGDWKPGQGWNGKLRYFFDGGCGSGKRQGNNNINIGIDNPSLSRGYAIVHNSMNAYRTGCDDVLSAETAMMMKEYFIERYGNPRYTIGMGGSGGGMQQHLIAQNYPGILDGIIPERSFPDGQTLIHTNTDALLLTTFFGSSTSIWTDAQKVAVSGLGVIGSLNGWAPKADRNSIYVDVCNAAIPVAQRYHPSTNPAGVRCTAFESMATYYGRDPVTGFARRPLDNVGIQYGLNALKNGVISVDQFLDLNEFVGGFDIDGGFQAARTTADAQAVSQGFKTGRVIHGKGMYLPIIDLRDYRDLGGGDVHTRFHSLEMRQRLINANGSADNQVILLSQGVDDSRAGFALEQMEQWLETLQADRSADSYAAKVLRARPSTLRDGCWHPTSGAWIDEATPFDPASACNQLFPYFGNPRTAAGGAITEDFVKCELRPIAMPEYSVPFTSAQVDRLYRVFNGGVCDYSRKSQHWTEWDGTWQSFGPAPRPTS